MHTWATAAAARLLDLGAFRIGNDAYTDANGSFGLTTLQRRHVRRSGDNLRFRFVGKSGIDHDVTVDDPVVIRALEVMRRRRGGGERLLAYRGPDGWTNLDPTMVNQDLADLVGEGTGWADGTATSAVFSTIPAAEGLNVSQVMLVE